MSSFGAGKAPLLPDRSMVQRSVKVLREPGIAVTETRTPKTSDGVIAGYFDDEDKLVEAIIESNGRGPGVYVGLNAVKLGLNGSVTNRIYIGVRDTVKDADIAWRYWLLIDVDPVRPPDTSSTDVQHEAALELARTIRQALRDLGWPEPILADSGNGGHLLFRIDLPNDAATKKLLQSVLKGLAAKFSTSALRIDTTTYNASRVSKAYGTVAAKGENTPEHPHRLSRMLEVPAELVPVSPEQLAAVAAWGAEPLKVRSQSKPEATGAAPGASLLDDQLDDQLIAGLRSGKNGPKFIRLYDEGRWEEDYPSHSEGDLGLASMLAHATGGDAGRIERLLGKSAMAREKWHNRPDYRQPTIAKAVQGVTGTWQPPQSSVVLAASAVEVSIDTLNATALFHDRLRIESVSRRGSMILATTTENQQIIWPTMTDLTSFARSRAVIAEGCDVLLPQPPARQVSKVWDPIAEMIIKLAARDALRVEHVLKAECKDLLILMWRRAMQPNARTSKEFMEFLIEIRRTVRDKDAPVPPCVFQAENFCWVHVPTFRNWLSLPSLTNRLYPLADIRQGLLLLGFAYHKDLTRGYDGDSESASLWRGPTDVLDE